MHLQSSTALVKAVASCRNGLVCPNDVEQEILERDENVKDLVAAERQQNERSRDHSVHEVVVGGRNNGDENEGRVSKANKQVKELPESVLAHLAAFERAAEKSRMVNHGHADAERVAKVHRRHGCELVDVFAAHPYTLRIVVSDGIEEPVLRGEQARRHAGVDDESDERAKVGQSHRPTGNSKCVERRRNVVVPTDEAASC